VWAPVRGLYEEGNYEAVIERGRDLIDANPQYSLPLYNLACCETLAGRKQDALAHLRQAVENSDRLAHTRRRTRTSTRSARSRRSRR
jgi:tetratricopeptide (TPR) repeat protein